MLQFVARLSQVWGGKPVDPRLRIGQPFQGFGIVAAVSDKADLVRNILHDLKELV